MTGCLATLRAELLENALSSGVFSCQGLSVENARILFSWDSAFNEYAGLSGESAAVIENVTKDTDPSPLLLVYSDEDCPNEQQKNFYRRALINQAHARLLCDLHTRQAEVSFRCTASDLLMWTTDGVFQYLGNERQKSLRRLIRDNIFKPIEKHWTGKQPNVVADKDLLTITWDSDQHRADFLSWLEDRQTEFSAEPQTQLHLFEEADHSPDAEEPKR